MDEVKKILREMQIPEKYEVEIESGWEAGQGSAEFLAPDFIRRYGSMAGFKPEELDRLAAFARKLEAMPSARALAVHASRWFREGDVGRFPLWPEIIPAFGQDTGMFYLLVGLSIIPDYFVTLERLGIPAKYAAAAATRFSTVTVYFAENYQGAFGILPRSLPFMRNYKNGTHFRIGRFDFQESLYPESYPRLFRKRGSREFAMICGPGCLVAADGRLVRRDHPESEASFISELSETADAWRGSAITSDGRISFESPVELSKREWDVVVSPGMPVAGIHIPGGGGMTPDVVDATLAEAGDFFVCYRKPVPVFTCASWILNTDLAEFMPQSNLALFQKKGFLFPVLSSQNGTDGLFFAFGRDDNRFSEYPRDNSLRRAILSILESGRLLRCGGILIPV